MLRFAEAEDDHNKVISALARIEAKSAITRLYKSRRMTLDESIAAVATVDAEARSMVEQPVSPSVIEMASALLDRHDLRALDAIQLGSAMVFRELLAVPDMRLIAADKALLYAAQNEGFQVWNPMVDFFE